MPSSLSGAIAPLLITHHNFTKTSLYSQNLQKFGFERGLLRF